MTELNVVYSLKSYSPETTRQTLVISFDHLFDYGLGTVTVLLFLFTGSSLLVSLFRTHFPKPSNSKSSLVRIGSKYRYR